MKLINMILLLLIIQGTIIFYDAVYTSSTGEYGDLGSYNDTGNILWDFAVNPIDWTDTSFLLLLVGLIGVSGAIGIGAYLYTKSDTILLFGVFTALIAIGAVPILSLYRIFDRNAAMFGCETIAISCLPGILMWLFTGGIIAVFYVLAVLEWWTGRTMSSG